LKFKDTIKDYMFLFLPALGIVLLDQWTKGLVRQNLANGEVFHPELWLSQYVRILHWHNPGIFLGMFKNLGLFSILLPIAISLGIIFYYPRIPRQDKWIRLAMMLYFGGGIGNLIDRFTQGYVTDFVSIGNFPVFNVADASISAGVVVLLFALYQKEKTDKKRASEAASNE